MPITFGERGKPVPGNDGRSFGQSIGEALFGEPKKPVSPWDGKPSSRKDIIARGGRPGEVEVRDNPHANGAATIGEFPSASQVGLHERHTIKMAKKYHLNPDLLRAIMYMETTHGWYDEAFALVDMEKSIKPMNINTNYWGSTWGSRKDLRNPEKNIEAGARMIRSILNAIPNATVAKVATIYNDSGATKVNDYGARVEQIYKSKPWLNSSDVKKPEKR